MQKITIQLEESTKGLRLFNNFFLLLSGDLLFAVLGLFVGITLSLIFFGTKTSSFQSKEKISKKHKRIICLGLLGIILCFSSAVTIIHFYSLEVVRDKGGVDYTEEVPELGLKV